MSLVEHLREFVNERLAAAAEEIFGVLKNTIVQYEDVIDRQRTLLGIVRKPEIKLHRIIELPRQQELTDQQQLCIQERNSSLNQEDPELSQIKEEQEEFYTSQEEDRETDAFMLTPTHEESNHSEPEPKSDHQLFSDNSQVADSRDHKGSKNVDSGSSRNAEPEPNEINVNDPNLSKIHRNTHTHKTFFECDFCGKTSTESTVHMKSHTGRNPYSCKMCGKAFRCNSNLLAHVRSHTGERPFKCKTCGRAFRHNNNLTAHMRIHTGDKRYSCKTCGRNFGYSSHLLTHIRSHTGERPFTCKTCGKAFKRNGDLTVHVRTHTGEKPYLCKTCGNKFISISKLRRHMRIHKT